MATFGWVLFGLIGSGLTAVVYLGSTELAIAYVGVALWGLFTSLVWGPAHTVLQRATPEAAHGRVMAADQLAQNLAMFLGLGLAGVAIGAKGVRTTIIGLSVFVVSSGVALWFAHSRSRAEGLPAEEALLNVELSRR